MKQETIDKYHLRILQVHLSEFAGQEDFVQAFKDRAMEILREHMAQAQIEEAIRKQKDFVEEWSHVSKKVWDQRAEDTYVVWHSIHKYDIVDVYVEGGVMILQSFLDGLCVDPRRDELIRIIYRSDMPAQIKSTVMNMIEDRKGYGKVVTVEIAPTDVEYQNFRNVDQRYLIEPYGLNLWWLNSLASTK
ncbi:MAG: hypothetical protein NC131_16020 [Roseburia sp.]|nr:hypothetical protein [Roseburia sp.]